MVVLPDVKTLLLTLKNPFGVVTDAWIPNLSFNCAKFTYLWMVILLSFGLKMKKITPTKTTWSSLTSISIAVPVPAVILFFSKKSNVASTLCRSPPPTVRVIGSLLLKNFTYRVSI
eukprot:Lithocolla_globosa_v1_NODE_933_length_3063_cov_11.302859.p3 type:complete len:116 gc:universal NODE_933_length_3063_cov_11.302859:1030-1377(+)